MDKPFVLIVLLDNDMKQVLAEAFQQYGSHFDIEFVSGIQETLYRLPQCEIQAIVMTKRVALLGDEGTNGLIKYQANLPPTVTLIDPGDGYPYYLYNPFKINDWITVPFDLQEFFNGISGVMRRAKEKRMIKISTKSQLIAALQDSSRRAENWFQATPAADFFTRNGEAWSPSDNVDHLIKAVKPISKALKLPKITLQAMFGKPEKPSMTYEELCKVYRDEIAKGAKASGRFLPDQETPGEHAQEKKQALLEQWSKANAELLSVVEKWDESELDRYLLPHPLIGKLTVREMIFFTIYHNLRHASLEGD